MRHASRPFAAAWQYLLPVLLTARLVCEAATPVPESPPTFIIKTWENDEGLPQNSVIAMVQTRDGYLWLGTLNGLARFDGQSFATFDESNTPGLPSSAIVSLFEDRKGNLWIGTETAGVVIVGDGRVTPLDLGRGTREGRLVGISEDETGTVWLYTADGQLGRHRGGRVDVWQMGTGPVGSYRGMAREPGGPLWVASNRAAFGLNPAASGNTTALVVDFELPASRLDRLVPSRQGGYWRLADGTVEHWVTNRVDRRLGAYPWGDTPIAAACEDAEGHLVVGTLGAGLYWFDESGHATNLSTNQGLSHNFILSLHGDEAGNLWVGTDGGGLNRVRRQVFETLPASRGQVVQSVAGDSVGALWVGYNGGGVDLWREGVARRFGPEDGLLEAPVRAVLPDRDGGAWVGTWGAGLLRWENGRFTRLAGAIPPVVSALLQDREGRVWAGTSGGLARWDAQGWRLFTGRDGLTAGAVRAIAQDPDGSLWLGLAGGGLSRLQDGQFTVLRKQPEGLPSDEVSALLADAEGVLWVGTAGSGLARLQAGRWTRYTTREGLVSNSIGYLLEDDHGHLWIGSNAGLMRVPKAALNAFARGEASFVPCRAFGKPDGLPTRECTQGSQPGAWRSADGRLWFATIKGLASVDPTRLRANPRPPPDVVIERVLVEGQPQGANGLRSRGPEEVIVPAGRHRIEIRYTSVNLAAPDRVRFRYRLESHEPEWIEVGNVREARYSRLPPGEYQFHVTACNEDGVWNETGRSLRLVLETPFWRSGWFLVASTAGLLGAVVAGVYFASTQRLKRQVARLRGQEALEHERSRIARDIHDQLGASLTQVALLGELVEGDKDSPAEVEEHGRQIAQTARETSRALDEIVWTVNPSNDTLEGLASYLCKYAQEYLSVAGLRYRIDIPPSLPATVISPEVRHNVFLAAKEAITNIVRHAQASSAWLRLHIEPERFTFEIQDDGRGPAGIASERARGRNGIRNMCRRLEDVGGQFTIEPAPDRGTRVRLSAPLGDRSLPKP